MSSVWVSRVKSVSEYGDLLGIADKHFHEDWAPPTEIPPDQSEVVKENMMRASRGETLRREELPECSYIWNAKRFRRNARDLFWVDGFMAVKGKLAEILLGADLGAGGLIPYPLFEADRVTPHAEDAYLLNLGGPKDHLSIEKSDVHSSIRVLLNNDQHTLCRLGAGIEDLGVALSVHAAQEEDLWCATHLPGSLFFSDGLKNQIEAADINVKFNFKKCRLIAEE